jgi:two-component system LytT family response regulator
LEKKIQKLPVSTIGGIHYIEPDNIICCTADSNYTNIFLLDGKKITASKTLKDFELLLSHSGFFRIYNSHLINLKYVERYIKGEGGYVIMRGGTSLEVSRQRKRELLKLLSL